MKINWRSRSKRRADRERKGYDWSAFIALWPRRISETQLIVGRCYRRHSHKSHSNKPEWEYCSPAEFAAKKLVPDRVAEKEPFFDQSDPYARMKADLLARMRINS